MQWAMDGQLGGGRKALVGYVRRGKRSMRCEGVVGVRRMEGDRGRARGARAEDQQRDSERPMQVVRNCSAAEMLAVEGANALGIRECGLMKTRRSEKMIRDTPRQVNYS